MATNPTQKLVILTVDPHTTHDLTPVLERMDWWGDGWTIQQVSLSPWGEKMAHAIAAVVLVKNDESPSSGIR
jgi:hypothetical protein